MRGSEFTARPPVRGSAEAVRGIACLLCGSRMHCVLPDETRTARAPAGHYIARCGGCGIVSLQPPLSPKEKAAVYVPGYYRAYAAAGGMAGGAVGVAPHLVARLRQVERAVGRERMLDVGCGEGFFLAHAESRGWVADGIEVSAAARSAQRRIARGRVFHGPIEAAPLEEGSYRFVHLSHVLEHLDDPIDVLRRALAWLAPGGILVLEVPNEFETLFHRIGRVLLPRRRRINPVPTSHQWFFNPTTLWWTAVRAGVAIDRIRTVRHQIGTLDRSAAVRWVKRFLYLFERPFDLAGMIELWGGAAR